MANTATSQIKALTDRWAATTYQVLHQQIRKHKIGDTEKLWLSIRDRVAYQGSSNIKYDLSFLNRGRFRDMGAGSSPKEQTKEKRRQLLKGRRPAKWYARPFYGRLNVLQGAIGYKVMEETIKAVTTGIKGSNGN